MKDLKEEYAQTVTVIEVHRERGREKADYSNSKIASSSISDSSLVG